MRAHLPTCPSRRRGLPARGEGGFSLVELLVVVAVISVMLALLMPSLAATREAAVLGQCLVHLRQVAVASLTYEMDQRRLPRHVYEQEPTPSAAAPAARMWCVTAGSVQGRNIWGPYLDLNFMRCPALPQLDYRTAAAANLFGNYSLTPGYVSDYGTAGWHGPRFTRSDQRWLVRIHNVSHRSDILVLDRMVLDASGYCIVNHPRAGSGFTLIRMDSPAAFGAAFRHDGPDLRHPHRFNAVRADASARTFDAANDPVFDLPDRAAASFLLPRSP